MTDEFLTHYKIHSEVGRGGMGVVYRAEDTRLHRTVALKVLPGNAVLNKDDRTRFFREARAAASIINPHVAVVYAVDEGRLPSDPPGASPRPFIAMEFVEGVTLTDLDKNVDQRQLTVKDILRIAEQITIGLQAAHNKGVVHRDIKSSNIMQTPSGDIKILDFGLALTQQATKLTLHGETLGTVAYMSPEQSRGEEVDHRTDLWSLGVCLYELIAGKRPFDARHDQAIMYKICHLDPAPLSEVWPGLPPDLESMVFRLLTRDPDARIQTADEVLSAIRAIDLSENAAPEATAGQISARSIRADAPPIPATGQITHTDGRDSGIHISRQALIALAGFVLLAASAYMVLRSVQNQEVTESPLRKIEVVIPGMENIRSPTLSPTQERMAVFGTDTTGQTGLFLFGFASGTLNYIRGSNEADPAAFGFSPDGAHLAFSTLLNGGVFTVRGDSDLPERRTLFGQFRFWEDANTFFLVDYRAAGPTYRQSLDRGGPERIVNIDSTLFADQIDLIFGMIPGTDLAYGHRGYISERSVSPEYLVLNLKTGETSIGPSGVYDPVMVAGGQLLFQHVTEDGPLVFRSVRSDTGELYGPTREVPLEIPGSNFSSSVDGSLVFVPRYEAAPDQLGHREFFLGDLETGSVQTFSMGLTDGAVPDFPTFSPDGKKVAVHVSEGRTSRYIGLYDLRTDTFERFTQNGFYGSPEWSDDGQFIYYDAQNVGEETIFRSPVSDASRIDSVLERARSFDLSPDGQRIASSRLNELGQYDMILTEMSSGTQSVIDSTVGHFFLPAFSPSGNALAYEARWLGRRGIRIFSFRDGQKTVLTDDFLLERQSAGNPVWARDGRSILYSVENEGIFRARIVLDPNVLIMSIPEKLFAVRGLAHFDVNPNGTILAISAPDVISLAAENDTEAAQRPATVVWWQNWANSLPDASDSE